MTSAPIAWRWQAFASPPAARATVAWRGSVRPLVHRLGQVLAGDDVPSLTVCAARDLLVVFGEPDDLPWVDGVQYAAPSAEDARLWLPTLVRPDVPHELLARALARRAGRQPCLLWHAPATIVPLDRQVPLSAAWLTRFSGCLDGSVSA